MAVIKSNLVDFMETPAADALDAVPAAAPGGQACRAGAQTAARNAGRAPGRHRGAHGPSAGRSLCQLRTGGGRGDRTAEGKLYAPADAVVDNLFDTHHAIGLVTAGGAELLLHIGIDTVKLKGQYFTAHVQAGQKVKKGDLLISFDLDAIRAAGYLCTTPLIVCNTDDYAAVRPLADGSVAPGQDLLRVE